MTATKQHAVDEAEAFTDLVCGDDDLVRAEFDDLIAACWDAPSKPPRRKPGPPAGGWARRPPNRGPRRPGVPLVTTVTTRRPQCRQRGPPAT
jgi:hypothetical protein